MNIKTISIMGILFAILSVIADHFVLWHPELNPLNNNFLFIGKLPTNQMIFGVWLGIFGVIGEVGFLYFLIEKLSPKSKNKKAIQVILFVLVNLGVAYHLMLGYLHNMVLAGIDLQSTLLQYVKPLEGMIGILFVLLNIFWFKLTRENEAYGKCLKNFLPAYIYIVGIGLYFIIPSIGQMIILCGLNLAIAVLFALGIFSIPQESSDF